MTAPLRRKAAGSQVTSWFGGFNQWTASNSFELISTQTVTGSAVSSVSFTSIPSTYRHLQLRYLWKCTLTAVNSTLRFNGDATSSYSYHLLSGNGAAASSSGSATQAQIVTGWFGANTSFGNAVVMDIYDYANTSKYKTTRSLAGYDSNGAGAVTLYSGLWMSTAAINQISIVDNNPVIGVGSTFALYGIS